ncbi:unnamed protein product [Aspergillus oryzae RIB40]|uniref:DNA, SC005 n=1 Tax=Aspergillus oryzae (strain ATCC 42149 / RIB 40) TaxID=510516 RepID=Q2UQ38_ASPOR|nr:unnamed protein product [Aspergillus oryzae RIB40]BAE56327.1 unnamed protein product [Aspergillus oryzae RIB40]
MLNDASHSLQIAVASTQQTKSEHFSQQKKGIYIYLYSVPQTHKINPVQQKNSSQKASTPAANASPPHKYPPNLNPNEPHSQPESHPHPDADAYSAPSHHYS